MSLTSSYEVTTLLRPRAALGLHQGVRPRSHLQGTFRAHVEEGQAAPRGRPRPFSMILTAWKAKSQKFTCRMLNNEPFRLQGCRDSLGVGNRTPSNICRCRIKMHEVEYA